MQKFNSRKSQLILKLSVSLFFILMLPLGVIIAQKSSNHLFLKSKVAPSFVMFGFSFPLKNTPRRISTYFGPRINPITGLWQFHNGIDLTARHDTVYCFMTGRVLKCGQDRFSGNYITINSNEYEHIYCHLSKILIKEGQEIKCGAAIAISGSTGRSTGEHLHFTLKYEGKYIDPMAFFNDKWKWEKIKENAQLR